MVYDGLTKSGEIEFESLRVRQTQMPRSKERGIFVCGIWLMRTPQFDQKQSF